MLVLVRALLCERRRHRPYEETKHVVILSPSESSPVPASHTLFRGHVEPAQTKKTLTMPPAKYSLHGPNVTVTPLKVENTTSRKISVPPPPPWWLQRNRSDQRSELKHRRVANAKQNRQSPDARCPRLLKKKKKKPVSFPRSRRVILPRV